MTKLFWCIFSFQITKADGLPTNICHRCLYNTELYSEFRDGVHRCERKLHSFVESLAGHSTNSQPHLPEIYRSSETTFVDQSDIVVIDPTKCYASSDEDESADEGDNDVHNNSNDQVNYELIASMYNKLALPNESQQPSAPPISKAANAQDGGETLRNIFFCKYCEAAFSERGLCEAHEKGNHDPISPFSCNFCSFRCDARLGVISHIKQFHGLDKPYVCVQCNKNFGRRADLKKHGVCHIGIRPFRCNICNKSFSRKTNVTKHMKTHQNNKLLCQLCKQLFASSSELQQHEKTHYVHGVATGNAQMQHHQGYSENMVFATNPFEQQFTTGSPIASQNLLNPYMNPMNPLAPSQPPNHQFNAKPTTPEVLDSVIYSKCTISTDSNSTQIPKLRLTKKIQKRYGCDKCSKTFAKMASLRNHKKTHSNADAPQPFWCAICSKPFKLQREFDRHNLIHTGVKNFQCSVCQKRFMRRDKLVRHEKIHAAKKMTAALPESAFLPENLKRGSHLHSAPVENKTIQQASLLQQQLQQPFKPDVFRPPNFYAEYDLSESQT